MRLVHAGAAFLIGILLARSLGVEGFGAYSFALSWILLAVSLLSAGLPQFLVREVSKNVFEGKIHQVKALIALASSLSVKIGITVIVLLVILAGSSDAAVHHYSTITLVIGVPAIALLVSASMQDALTRGVGHVIRGQLSEFVARPLSHFVILLILLYVVAASGKLTASQAMAAFTLAASFGLATSMILRKRATNSIKVGDIAPEIPENNASWTRQIISLALIGWVGAINAQIGNLVLGTTGEISELSYFRVASQLSQLIPLGLIAIEAHQAPSISRLNSEGNKVLLQQLAQRNARLSLLFAAPVGIALILLGQPILSFVFGVEFAGGTNSLNWLALGQILNAAAGSVGVFMIAAHMERGVLIALGAATILNVIAAIAFTPIYGAAGTAFAACLSLACWNLIMIAKLKRHTGILSLPINL